MLLNRNRVTLSHKRILQAYTCGVVVYRVTYSDYTVTKVIYNKRLFKFLFNVNSTSLMLREVCTKR